LRFSAGELLTVGDHRLQHKPITIIQVLSGTKTKYFSEGYDAYRLVTAKEQISSTSQHVFK
jgi:hypothetical protein